MARLKYLIWFILYQIVVMLCHWFCDETSQFELDKYFYSFFFSWKLPYLSIAHVRKFGHVTLLGMIHFVYAKSNLNHFRQKPPSMEAISQIIRSVGLFVSSSPEVTISTKIQPFLYLLKNGSIEVPDLVYSLPNCCDVVSLILWWNITGWAWQVFFFIFFFMKITIF